MSEKGMNPLFLGIALVLAFYWSAELFCWYVLDIDIYPHWLVFMGVDYTSGAMAACALVILTLFGSKDR